MNMKRINGITYLLKEAYRLVVVRHLCMFVCVFGSFSCSGVADEIVTIETPLTIEAIEGGEIVLTPGCQSEATLNYRINRGNVKTVTVEDSCAIKLSKGDKIELLGDNDVAPQIPIAPKCYVYGNVMSLLNSTSYREQTSIESFGAFRFMFSDNESIMFHDSKDLFLPAERLSKKCYQGMFYGCSGITRTPELPAKILAKECYAGMFADCTSLTSAPELPATILAEGCYSGMFAGCTSLTSAPELPAMRMEEDCYREMFYGCTQLTKAPELPAMQLAKKCYKEMFYNCLKLVDPPTLPATQLERDCYEDMFGNGYNKEREETIVEFESE